MKLQEAFVEWQETFMECQAASCIEQQEACIELLLNLQLIVPDVAENSNVQ